MSVIEVRKFQRSRIKAWIKQANEEAQGVPSALSTSRKEPTRRRKENHDQDEDEQDVSSFPYLAQNYFAGHAQTSSAQVYVDAKAGLHMQQRAGRGGGLEDVKQGGYGGVLGWLRERVGSVLRLGSAGLEGLLARGAVDSGMSKQRRARMLRH